MDHAFEADILEAFATLAARGFIQRGLRSIHWCPTDRTALAEAEIEYEDDVSPSIHVRFPLRRDPRRVLASFPGGSAGAGAPAPRTPPPHARAVGGPPSTTADASRPRRVRHGRAGACSTRRSTAPSSSGCGPTTGWWPRPPSGMPIRTAGAAASR